MLLESSWSRIRRIGDRGSRVRANGVFCHRRRRILALLRRRAKSIESIRSERVQPARGEADGIRDQLVGRSRHERV